MSLKNSLMEVFSNSGLNYNYCLLTVGTINWWFSRHGSKLNYYAREK